MIAKWTTYSAGNALQFITNTGAPSAPTSFWLALSATTADPAESWTELAIANYARQQVTFVYGGDVYATSSNEQQFMNLGAGSFLGVRIYDADTAGNAYWWGDMSSTQAFSSGHNIIFSVGKIKVSSSL